MKRTSLKHAETRVNAAHVETAVDTLMRGYEEEINLYLVLRKLTLNQREMLLEGGRLERFCDLHEEKEDLLAIIGQIDDEMASAKGVVVEHRAEEHPKCVALAHLLDRLTDVIEDTRRLEGSNAMLLQVVPQSA